MDPATGSIAIFQACLQGYRVIAQAVEVGSDSVLWDVLMRIELTRFEVWGRELGFLDEKTGKEIPPKELKDTLADVLQIESARNLVRDILTWLKKLLDEFKQAANRYNLQPNTPPLKAATDVKQRRLHRFEAYAAKVWKSSKDFTMRLLLVINDKDKMTDLLKNLKACNDGLENVLSVSQRAMAAKALPSKVLVDYDDPEHLSVFTAPSASRVDAPPPYVQPGALHIQQGSSRVEDGPNDPRVHRLLAETARVKQLCIRPVYIQERSSLTRYQLHTGNFHIPNVPRNSSREVIWPVSEGQYQFYQGSYGPVVVEWRLPDPLSLATDISTEELVQRRSMVVDLLHQTSKLAAADYHVLDCFGWFESTGQTNDGKSCKLVGFASKIPSWADVGRKPVTLNELLTTAFASDEPGGAPSLRTRFQLARDIAEAVYQLQCSRWLHRMLSSHQILFFYDEQTTELRYDSPYLIGLQYSRPDDQKEPKQSGRPAQMRSEGMAKNLGSLGIYLHPELLEHRGRRYRRSDDLYSLGMILFEIAFWEPLQAFEKGDDPQTSSEVSRRSKEILKTAKVELDAEVGPVYQQVVLGCLEGLREQLSNAGDSGDQFGPGNPAAPPHPLHHRPPIMDYDGIYRGEDPEYDLESHVLWRVVRELEKCRV